MTDSQLRPVVYFDLGDTLIHGPANNRVPYTDAVNTLWELHGRGYRLGILSDQASSTTIADVIERLAEYGFANYIDMVTISSELPGNILKPDPRIFHRALQKTGHPQASEMIVFVTENSTHVAAARDLGWRAILKRNTGSCMPSDGECVTGLSGLLTMLLTVILPGFNSNLHLAPPVRIVDGLAAIPIDIQQVDARVIFDMTTRRASVEAVMRFITGNTSGNPVFDLRQNIQEAYLNGNPIPTSRLRHHDFGGGPNAELIILEQVLSAGSENTLRLIYTLDQPQSPFSQPIGWDPPRLYFEFWFTDLYAARYLEMWFPSNLIYDEFGLNLDIEIINTGIEHIIYTNGQLSQLAQNHWVVQFPERFTSLSPMLCVVAADRIERRQGTMTLPDTGAALLLDTFKMRSETTNLVTVENNVRTFITNNVNDVGSYIHGDRFTTFLWSTIGRSMEYEGAVTTVLGSLKHEVFHSWFARGVKLATQNDSWMDEGWTVYYTSNGLSENPFNMFEPPVTLSSQNPFNRITPGTSYGSGSRFFAGLAATLGPANLRSYMSSFYREKSGTLVTTGDLESHLICRSGRIEIADHFHRFVFGFDDILPSQRPDLYIRDASDDPGFDQYVGTRFWDSPDLWVRNADDGGMTHQSPKYDQDNWFYARVRNRGIGTAKTFVITFNVKVYAGTQFVYPEDFIPCTAAAVGFNLEPGESTIVKAKWPRSQVPPTGSHACLLVSVYTPTDEAPTGRHVWEHNNLAQKNLTAVDLVPNFSFPDSILVGQSLHIEKGNLPNRDTPSR